MDRVSEVEMDKKDEDGGEDVRSEVNEDSWWERWWSSRSEERGSHSLLKLDRHTTFICKDTFISQANSLSEPFLNNYERCIMKNLRTDASS